MFGRVASEPTVSRLIATLAADAPKALDAIASARGSPVGDVATGRRARARRDFDAEAPLMIDLDATLVTAHSDKERAAPNFKRGYGFHPLCALPTEVGWGPP